MKTVCFTPVCLSGKISSCCWLFMCLLWSSGVFAQSSAVAQFTLGQQKRNQGKYAEAVRHFTQALDLDASLVQAYELRGYSYARLRKYREALKDYNKALAMGYENAMLYLNRGWAYYSLGEKDEACINWEKSNLMGYKGVEKVLKKHCGF